MSGSQIIAALCLAGLFAWRGVSFSGLVLLANFGAALMICYGMDIQALGRDEATLAMMLDDLICAAVLLSHPGLPRVIAVGYAITVPIYALNILWGVQIATTFAIVNAMGFLQIAVAGIGESSDDGGGRGRFAHDANPVSLQGRDYQLGQMADMAGYPLVSPNRGGK